MNFRTRFQRFLLRNRNKGIPNLMLYIVLGCGIVTALQLLGYNQIYGLLCFDRAAILRGQVWRLFSYVFTMSSSNILTTLILLYCYYSLGRAVENAMGTFKFNLYYLSGILLMDIFALGLGGITAFWDYSVFEITGVDLGQSAFYSSYMVSFLHLSMIICFATLYPDAQFMLFFLIPIKAKILSLIYFGYTLFMVLQLSIPVMILPHNLFPLVAFANYFIFFGKDVANLLPLSWRTKRRKSVKKHTAPKAGTVQFRAPKTEPADFSHRCTVCGRTDKTSPEIEFRYCSRCAGYHCYCEDHINDHEHIL